MKLKETFMTSDTIDYFMSQPDGANYVVLYQMLCLKTINTNGKLSRQIGEIIIPYDVEKIQRDCKWFSIDTVRVALKLYQAVGLIYEDVNGVLTLSDHKNLVGSETDFAVQKKLQRENKCKFLPEGVDNGVDNVHTDIEKDNRDKILDIRDEDINNMSDKPTGMHKIIIDYLNEKADKKYRANNKSTQKHINARLKEGYTVEDFKIVIDKKCTEWKNTEMEQYLRPETLFGTKFEGYLNSKTSGRQKAQAQQEQGTGNIFVDMLKERQQKGEFGYDS